MSGNSAKSVRHLPSTGVFIAAGVTGAAAIGVGSAWAYKKHSSDDKHTPTPTTVTYPAMGAPLPTNRAGDDIDITTQVGLQPSLGQNTDGTVWNQTQQGTASSATFTLDTDDGAAASLSQTRSGVNVVNVSAGTLGRLDNVVYKSSNMSTNTNGYMFQDWSSNARVTSFLVPFQGDTCGFGTIFKIGDNYVAQGFGFDQGTLTTYDGQVQDIDTFKWSQVRQNNHPADVIPDSKVSFNFLLVTVSVDSGRYTQQVAYAYNLNDKTSGELTYAPGYSKIFTQPNTSAFDAQIFFESTSETEATWGGTIVQLDKNFVTDDKDMGLQLAKQWESTYAAYQRPQILNVITTQVYYVGFDADARGYDRPSVNNPAPTDDNIFVLDTALPEGMTFDANLGTFGGTPLAPYKAQLQMVYRNTVSQLSADPVVITLTVEPAPSINYGDTNYLFYTEVQSDVPAPTVQSLTIGVADSFTIDPVIANGFTFNSATGEISGTPTAVAAATEYTIAANDNGNVIPRGTTCDPVTVSIEVKENPTPDPTDIDIMYPSAISLDYQQAFQTIYPVLKVNGEVVPVIPDAVFTISPDLPTGVVLNPATGTISGAATEIAAPLSYSIKCTVTSDIAYATVQLDVEGAAVLPKKVVLQKHSTLDYTITYEPELLNGYTVLSSDIQPPLPEGLTVDGARIYGTVETDDLTEHTYKVRTAFELPTPVQDIGYTLANGTFLLQVEDNRPKPGPDDGSSSGVPDWYLGTTVAFATVSVVLFIIGGILLKHEKSKSS